MTIIEALRDRRLFGALPAFQDLSSWQSWIVFLKAAYGLPMSGSEHTLFRRHTGRSEYTPPRGGWREVVSVVGRQSGKSRIAALIASASADRRDVPVELPDAQEQRRAERLRQRAAS